MLGVICTPKVAQGATDLADRAPGTQCLAHRRQKVLVPRRDLANLVERRSRSGGIAL
jgi:hypothetical protein